MHTPGPWTMKQGRNKSLWVMAPDETCVSEIGGHFEGHHEANARLIAAAPDLLAALEWFAKRFNAGMSEPEAAKLAWAFGDVATAAIAKARGQ
jgi:hypothetical protein